MKKLVIFLLAIGISGVAAAQGRVVVSISNFKNNKGVCQVCLFDNEASFSGKGEPFRCMQVTVQNKTGEAVFENVPAGTYAVSVFHDENKNYKLDTNMFGIPKEGYGASKNKLPFASAPTFIDNKFPVENQRPIRLAIKLRYI